MCRIKSEKGSTVSRSLRSKLCWENNRLKNYTLLTKVYYQKQENIECGIIQHSSSKENQTRSGWTILMREEHLAFRKLYFNPFDQKTRG